MQTHAKLSQENYEKFAKCFSYDFLSHFEMVFNQISAGQMLVGKCRVCKSQYVCSINNIAVHHFNCFKPQQQYVLPKVEPQVEEKILLIEEPSFSLHLERIASASESTAQSVNGLNARLDQLQMLRCPGPICEPFQVSGQVFDQQEDMEMEIENSKKENDINVSASDRRFEILQEIKKRLAYSDNRMKQLQRFLDDTTKDKSLTRAFNMPYVQQKAGSLFQEYQQLGQPKANVELDRILGSLRLDSSLSQQTLRERKSTIKRFFASNTLTFENLEKFAHSCSKQQLRAVYTLSSFLESSRQAAEIKQLIKELKVQAREHKPRPHTAMKRTLFLTKLEALQFSANMNASLIMLFLTGARLGELGIITVEMVRKNVYSYVPLKKRRKGQTHEKKRLFSLSESDAKWAQSLVSEANPTSNLFLGYTKENFCKLFANQVRVNPLNRFQLHDLRFSRAQEFFFNGGKKDKTVDDVRDFFGHKSSETTRIYLRGYDDLYETHVLIQAGGGE